MPGSPSHFNFNESSNDESDDHLVEVVPLADDTVPHASSAPDGEQPQRLSLIRRAVGGIAAMIDAVFPIAEPLVTSRASRELSSTSSDLQFVRGNEINEPIGSHLSADLSEQDELTLLEVIEQYNRTPDDVYMRIILAALTAENVAVNGEMFRAAAGNCVLIEMLLHSGKVDVNDPNVQSIIQSEIAAAVVGDEAHDGRLAPEKIGFLTMLCRVPSATLTREQAQLCAHSGFEFVEMLEDSRHVLRNISPPRWIISLLFDILYIIEAVINGISLIALLVNIACVIWIAYFWFTNNDLNSFGYWTISCYVIGYLFSIVATMTSEEGRMHNYEHHIWSYPDNSLKVIPLIPLYEFALMYAILRYRLHYDKSRYFVIRYDLYNGATNLFIIDTLFLAMPQMLMQYYFFKMYAVDLMDFPGFRLLVVVGSISYGLSIFLFIRKVMRGHSCNNFGFAVVASMQAPTLPIDITLRILIIMLVYYIECNAFSLLFSLLQIDNCSKKTAALVIALASVEGVVIVGLVLAMIFERPRWTIFFCFPILFSQIAISAYSSVIKKENGADVDCKLFSLTSSFVSPYTYITFVFWSVSLLLWIAFFLYYRITGKQLYPYWEQFYLTELKQ